MERQNFLSNLRKRSSFNCLEYSELFARLKEQASTPTTSDNALWTFDLSKIQQTICECNPKSPANSSKLPWKGNINHNEFLAILNISITQPRALFALSDKLTYKQLLDYCLLNQSKALIISEWGFPFGGAEAFHEETSVALYELGFKVEWINFQIPGKGRYQKDNIIEKEVYVEYQLKDIPTTLSLSRIIQARNPDIVFSHGAISNLISAICDENGIAHIEGFHFWTGLVDLYNYSNKNISENISKHRLVQGRNPCSTRGSQTYLVSDFMQEVYEQVGGKEVFKIITPLINLELNTKYSAMNNGFVSQFDLSVGKGGHIFCDLVERLGHKIPFLGVVRDTTEEEIKVRLNELKNRFPLLKLERYSEMNSLIQMSSLVLVPSLVDETYCRVAEEAVRLGVPTFTSFNGNLKTLFNGEGAITSDISNDWKQQVELIYNNKAAGNNLWKKQFSAIASKAIDSLDILDLILNSVNSRRFNSVGIFTANGSQGLGSLAKVLAKQLYMANLQTYIFAFTPYNINLSTRDYWSNLEFMSSDHLFASKWTREHVPISEILNFIDQFKIDIFIFPEVCWVENWARLYEIKKLRPNLRVVIVPMLETVINHEVENLKNFDLIMFPTNESRSVLERMGITNGLYIGFTSQFEEFSLNQIPRQNIEEKCDIKFLHIAGHNPSIRKKTYMVISEFLEALKVRQNISLTITMQNIPREYESLDLPKEIQIIKGNLSDSQIADLYIEHDVSIQIPSHEGIGLGFYESISVGTPVVTLDHAPHNEVIVQGCSGWLLPVIRGALPDNPSGIVNAANLAPGSLTSFIVNLDIEELKRVSEKTTENYQESYSNSRFAARLVSAIFSKRLLLGNQKTPYVKKFGLLYEDAFNRFIRFGEQFVYKKVPISIKQKHRIKMVILRIDQFIRKVILRSRQ